MSKLGLEIKNKIDTNNRLIESLLDPATFVLNNEISGLINENEKLRESCPHEFEDGLCIYCGKKED